MSTTVTVPFQPGGVGSNGGAAHGAASCPGGTHPSAFGRRGAKSRRGRREPGATTPSSSPSRVRDALRLQVRAPASLESSAGSARPCRKRAVVSSDVVSGKNKNTRLGPAPFLHIRLSDRWWNENEGVLNLAGRAVESLGKCGRALCVDDFVFVTAAEIIPLRDCVAKS